MKSSKLVFIVILFIVVYIVYKNITSSVILNKKDRINIVFYSGQTTYYSLGFKDVSYVIPFPVNTEVMVPGGYGYYRVGAFGKLLTLEKKPDILRKTFSAATFSFVDLYFYPQKSIVYYQDSGPFKLLPVWQDIFLFSSNANIVDRLLLAWQFMRSDPNQYQIITDLPTRMEGNRAVFDQDNFDNKYQGFFYKKTYRNIKDNVQILYTKNYNTALLLSRIIEGEGIRVVDISQISNSQFPISNCLVVQNKNASIVASDLQKYFHCQKKEGRPDVSDIIITLGSLENEWQ